MARVFEHQGMANDGAIKAFDIVTFIDHGLPPCGLKVVLEFYAQRTKVIKTLKSAINFSGLKNKATALAEADELRHVGGRHEIGFSPKWEALQGGLALWDDARLVW